MRRFRFHMTTLLCVLLLILSLCGFAQAESSPEVPAINYALQISEAQSNNDAEWALDFQDYIELYNAGDTTVSLSQYFLTRDEAEPFACHLPAEELAPGEYILLICDVDLRGLRLPKEGCELFLYHRDGTLCGLPDGTRRSLPGREIQPCPRPE